MITSKEVFAKRKEGAVDEAYRMGLELMASPDLDNWGKKAFCWCLIDIIKRDASNGDNQHLPHYRSQLESIEVDTTDEVLAKGKRNALSLCTPNGREISQAKALSKEGRHAEAVAAYRRAFAIGPADRNDQTGFGWDLYRHAKELMAAENINLGAVKRNLSDYLKLDVERPSLLHSCVLQLAAKLAGQDKFSMMVFSRLWNLDNLRPDDFERYRADDGKEYPSLAEKVIQQVGKEAAASDNKREQEGALPHLDLAIKRFPDNIWLKLDKAKVLLSLGMHDDALAFGIAVAKAKPNEYWAWGLLGDIVSLKDEEAALGCYCKALTSPAEEKFRGRIRLKVAKRMIECNLLSAAKFEVLTVINSKESEGYKVPAEAVEIASQQWFDATEPASSNNDFYKSKQPDADALLFGDLPWVNACVGETFTVTNQEGKQKQRRKIFIETTALPLEVSIPETKLERRKVAAGDAIRVKGELVEDKGYILYLVEVRDSNIKWDVLSESIGVVYQVNREKGIVHFIVNSEIDGFVQAEISTTFVEGDSIALRLSKSISRKGSRLKIHEAKATDKEPSSKIKRPFCEAVQITNGMGFTEGEIFIPPPLVLKNNIQDGQTVSGTAVRSFNKKRSSWGWKAISIAANE